MNRVFSQLFFSILFIFLLNSCEEAPDVIGLNLLPGGDIISITIDSLGVVQGYTQAADSVIGSNKTKYILGSQVDPYFGFSKAELVSQIQPAFGSGSFGSNPVPYSLTLTLIIDEKKGIGADPLRISVYEYLDSIDSGIPYYSSGDITGKYRDPALGTGLVTENDSIVQIEITDMEFINKFLTAEDSILTYTEALRDLVKGLYITCDDAMSEGEGGYTIFDWNGNDHRIDFLYKDDSLDSLNQSYLLGLGTTAINLFRHNNTGHPIEPYIDSGSDNDSLLFIQSMGGVSSVIRINGLTSWKEDSVPVAIINARLTIPVVDSNLTQQTYVYAPERINVVRRFESIYLLTYDDILSQNGAGGEYDEETNSYIFDLKVHIQSIIQGDLEDDELILRSYRNAETVCRTVLQSYSHDTLRRMKLEITYTRL